MRVIWLLKFWNMGAICINVLHSKFSGYSSPLSSVINAHGWPNAHHDAIVVWLFGLCVWSAADGDRSDVVHARLELATSAWRVWRRCRTIRTRSVSHRFVLTATVAAAVTAVDKCVFASLCDHCTCTVFIILSPIFPTQQHRQKSRQMADRTAVLPVTISEFYVLCDALS